MGNFRIKIIKKVQYEIIEDFTGRCSADAERFCNGPGAVYCSRRHEV